MKIFAISDLHLSINNPKPMDIFGPVWDNYLDKIITDWKQKVGEDDVVVMTGDFSWAMKLEQAVADINLIGELPGKKIIIRGNHDYWWSSISKIRNLLPQNFYAIQNDSIKIGNYIFCGTRGWTTDDNKLFEREYLRLEMSLKSAKQQQSNNEEIIVLLHFPPFDKGLKKTKFMTLIEEYGVKKVIYGHLHRPNNQKINIINTINGVSYYLTSCDMLKNSLLEIQ